MRPSRPSPVLHVTLPLLLALLLAAPARAERLVFAYPDRPPYNHTENGRAVGILVELTADIAAEAGVEPEFQEMPSQRVLEEMRRPGSTLCSFGWFKTPEREAFARFTSPFYRDPPLMAVALRRCAPALQGRTTLQELAGSPLQAGLVRGWSYGAQVENILREANARVDLVPERPSQARMLAAGRFDYILARAAEVGEIASLAGLSEEDLIILPLADLTDAGQRHILCGRGVPPEVLARIDAAIARRGLPAP